MPALRRDTFRGRAEGSRPVRRNLFRRQSGGASEPSMVTLPIRPPAEFRVYGAAISVATRRGISAATDASPADRQRWLVAGSRPQYSWRAVRPQPSGRSEYNEYNEQPAGSVLPALLGAGAPGADASGGDATRLAVYGGPEGTVVEVRGERWRFEIALAWDVEDLCSRHMALVRRARRSDTLSSEHART